jgi:predicted nucleic acid-binding protein
MSAKLAATYADGVQSHSTPAIPEVRMPEYRIAETVLDIARNAILLDTNVLVAAFYQGEAEGRRDNAQFILNEWERPLLVPSAVIIEAWGFVVGGRKDWDGGAALLTWLNEPGRAVIVPPFRADVYETQQLIHELSIDCVDAMLAELATNITEQCELSPALPIATFDTSDFFRMLGRRGLRLSVFDMRTMEDVPMG